MGESLFILYICFKSKKKHAFRYYKMGHMWMVHNPSTSSKLKVTKATNVYYLWSPSVQLVSVLLRFDYLWSQISVENGVYELDYFLHSICPTFLVRYGVWFNKSNAKYPFKWIQEGNKVIISYIKGVSLVYKVKQWCLACYLDLWHLTFKINRCRPLAWHKKVCVPSLTVLAETIQFASCLQGLMTMPSVWHWPLTFKINRCHPPDKKVFASSKIEVPRVVRNSKGP